MKLAWFAAVLAGAGASALSGTSLGHRSHAVDWNYAPRVSGIPVTGLDGKPMAAPFLGGFDVPRPQLVDINGGVLQKEKTK